MIKEVHYILGKFTIYKRFKRFKNVSFPFPFSLAQTANENETVGALLCTGSAVQKKAGFYGEGTYGACA
jgi:hypothetical protein